MNMKGNTILITGGATGIGLSLAEDLIREGNTVIVCGRREEKLKEAKAKLPQLHTRQCDLSKEKERKSLHDWTLSNFPSINILVNNAGIQRMIDLKKGTQDLLAGEDEIETNFKAYVQMAAYFIPDLMQRKEAAIINVSSGLGFVPIAVMPIYCATKAAIHSYTVSLRHQLKPTPIKVFEIIPPTVDTELDRGARARRGQAHMGIQPSEVATEAMKALEKDEYEITVGQSKGLKSVCSQEAFQQMFNNMNRW